MKFAVIVHAAPGSAPGSRSAQLFVQALIDAGMSINRVFFYHEGVRSSNGLSVSPQDETSVRDQWISLRENHGIELAVCIAAALKRGILNEAESERYGMPAASIHPAFEVVGLGQLIEAVMTANRVITFGA